MSRPDIMDAEADASRLTLSLACLARMNWGAAPHDMTDLNREELGALFELLKEQGERIQATLTAIQLSQLKP